MLSSTAGSVSVAHARSLCVRWSSEPSATVKHTFLICPPFRRVQVQELARHLCLPLLPSGLHTARDRQVAPGQGPGLAPLAPHVQGQAGAWLRRLEACMQVGETQCVLSGDRGREGEREREVLVVAANHLIKRGTCAFMQVLLVRAAAVGHLGTVRGPHLNHRAPRPRPPCRVPRGGHGRGRGDPPWGKPPSRRGGGRR